MVIIPIKKATAAARDIVAAEEMGTAEEADKMAVWQWKWEQWRKRGSRRTRIRYL